MTASIRLTLAFVAASFVGVTAKPGATSGSFTLAQVMSAPFASAPLAAPTGASVAWLLNEQGRRSIWVATAPDWKGRKITSFNEDDGQEIAELSWTPNGKSLFFARGGDFEMGREAPNPAFAPERPKQEIWEAYLDDRPCRQVAEGHSPAASPKGDLVAFIKENQVYSASLDGRQSLKLFDAKGVADLTWSPDGDVLAFVSNRGDHGFIGFYRPGTKKLTYLNPSIDHDAYPSWSADSKRIAYVRVPATSRPFAFGPERDGEPWSIWVTDVESGQSKRIFSADEGPGSVFRPVVAHSQLFWSGGKDLVFPWEKTGWLHLYAVNTEGGRPHELTPGEGELEHVARAEESGALYYSSNIGDTDRRHLFKLDPAHPDSIEQLTQGEGIEFEPAPTSDGSGLVFLASSYNQKSHAEIRTSDGKTKTLVPETVPAEFPSRELVKPQPVLLTSADGMVVHGQLFLPAAGREGERHPAAVFFHGGSRRQMLLGFHSMYYYSNAYAMNQYLANHGYVVLSVNYRSGIGYGLNFREALHYGATGASEFNDVIGAGLYLKSRPDVEPNHIGVWGGSYGGYLTALALARASDLFAAGVDFHGVHDWNAVIENFVPAYDPKTQADAARIAFESSPMAWVNTWKSPVLLIHGDDDRNVPFSETVRLAVALRQQRVPFEELIFPNEIHDFLRQKDWVAAYEAAAGFFQRKLSDRVSR